jgi:hypothetical protein
MATPLEHSSCACGLCGSTADELSSPWRPSLEAHGVALEQLEGSSPIGATWTFADGRV